MLSRVTNRLAFRFPTGGLSSSLSARVPTACSPLACFVVSRKSSFSTLYAHDCKSLNSFAPKNTLAIVSGINFIAARNFGVKKVAKRSYTGHSVQSTPAKLYNYEDINKIISGTHPSIVLIDSREPNELEEQGKIPSAVNIPYKSCPGALGLSKEQFEDTFGFPKPGTDKELVFYCQGGVRSTAAEDLAATYGYEKRGNYKGSFKDWVQHNGKIDHLAPPSKESAAEEPKK